MLMSKQVWRGVFMFVVVIGMGIKGHQVSRASEDEPVERSIELQGGKLHSLVAGPADGFPVLLLHGRRFHSGTWLETRTYQTLASHGYRVVGLDLPGYGRSEKSDIPRERFLAELIPKLGMMSEPVIVAPSMSGGVAFPLLIENPELASGFVAVASAGIRHYQSELHTIKVPTLILWGEKDTISPLSLGEQLKSRIEGSRMVVLPGASHPCYLDRPDEFHQALLEFLESIRFSNKK